MFIAGRSDLQPLPPGVTGVVGEPDGSCSVSRHSCLMTFYVFPDAFHGSLVMVWGVLVGDLTRNPRSQGPSPAGFEFPVAVEIPAPGESTASRAAARRSGPVTVASAPYSILVRHSDVPDACRSACDLAMFGGSRRSMHVGFPSRSRARQCSP